MTGLGLDDGSRDVVVLGDGLTMEIHGPAVCAGERCVFHNPSPHPLVNAPTFWMRDVNLIMRRCPHDRLHPDPDSLWWLHTYVTRIYDGWHPCCPERCCEMRGDQ